MITDYASLKAEVIATSHRGDQATRVPLYIQRAESMIASRMRCMYNADTAGIGETERLGTSGVLFRLATDTLEVIHVNTPTGDVLTRRSVVELNHFTTSGAHVHSYALRMFDNAQPMVEFRASVSTIDVAAPYGYSYFKRRAAFSADADTNVMLTGAPDLYLNAALHWLYMDAHDLDMATVHRQLFDEEADRLNTDYKRAMRSQGVNALAYVMHGSDY